MLREREREETQSIPNDLTRPNTLNPTRPDPALNIIYKDTIDTYEFKFNYIILSTYSIINPNWTWSNIKYII